MKRKGSGRLLIVACTFLTLALGSAPGFAPHPLTRQASAGESEAPKSLQEYGEEADVAIERGLAWLARQQIDNGSFGKGGQSNTGIASLCIMAFLAKGHTPGVGPYGDVINKGIDFVLGSAKENGLLVDRQLGSGPMYSHAISALFLSEVSGMVDPERQEKIDTVLPYALEVILAAQKVKKSANQQGGWRYHLSSKDSDISCTGWPLMALRSARNNGASVPGEAISEGIQFVMNCRNDDGGFAYQPGKGSGLARTGTALLCLELTGHHAEEAATGAGDWILTHPQRSQGQSFYYYGLYYCAQGMFQLGGDHWERFARHMYEMMLRFQAADGSWPQGSGNEARAGTCYATAMSVLAMSVTYRQLPIYQR